MKLNKYLKDKLPEIIVFIIFYSLITIILLAFKSQKELNIFILFLLLIMGLIIISIDYLRKRNFYNSLLTNIKNLDKKYLLIEFINKPEFYEGQIFYEILYETNKAYIENLNNYKKNINSYKEYVEAWIHEVKLPISTIVLLSHNNKLGNKIKSPLKKLDNYIDQILYYVRSENAEKDYIIKENNIKKIINNVLLKNKDDILEQNIELKVEVSEEKVLTDSKWLEFIINQIINNSIKYKKEKNAQIKITYKNNILEIYDNGIGIKESDIPRVFDKMFTGENGRNKAKSTGMGLYIAREMCKKLGHKILVESKKDEYTKIEIIFGKNEHYKNVI